MVRALEIIGILTLTLAATAPRAAAEPVLNATSPLNFQRGTSTPIVFRGARLTEDNVRLLSYTEGITLTDWTSEKPETASAVLHVDAEVPLGLHAVRLVSSRGMSALRTIYVGSLPSLAEAEPNDRLETPQPLTHDCTVRGKMAAGDEDWYAVDVKEGWPRLSIEVHGLRLGRRFVDPVIELYGPDDQMMARCDDSPLARQDPILQVPNPTPGTYKVMIRDAMYRGGAEDHYLLHVGRFPRPDGASPTGAPAGTELNVAWLFQGQTVDEQSITLPAEGTGTIELFPEDADGMAPSSIPFELGATVTPETEPNNNPPKAQSIEWPVVIEATLDRDGDIDYFKFSATKGQVIRLAVNSRSQIRSPVDAIMTILNAKGGYLTSNDDGNGPDCLLDYTVPEDGDYLVAVRDFLRRGGRDYRYRLQLDVPPRRLQLELPERARNQSITVAVPQGNRMAALVQVKRQGTEGEVRLEPKDLPEGVASTAPQLAKDRTRVPIVFSAHEKALPTATLTRLEGVCLRDNESVGQGELFQRQLLVAGENNRYMWGYEDTRLALAVTQRIPFRITLAVPQVPIVQRGVMKLRLEVERDEGFEAPITVQSLYMPPGLSGKGSVTIPEKANSLEYVLNANDKARLGEPSIVMLGRASVDGANVQASTELVPLRVAAPYVAVKRANTNVLRGGTRELKLSLTVNTPFEGPATAELMNLPAGVSAEAVSFAAEDESLRFTLVATADAKLGRRGGMMCRVVITQNEEPIVHMLPLGQVRVDPAATEIAGT